MKRRTVSAIIAFIFLFFLLVGCSRDQREVAAVPTPDLVALQMRTVEALRTTLDEHYVYHELTAAEWSRLYDEYRSQVEAGLGSEQFASGMAAILSELPAPPVLQTRQERIDQVTAASNSYGGIGAFVTLKDTPEPHIVLLSVMPNTPAESAGLLAHDSVLAIDGNPIEAGDVSLSINRLRGEPDSDVTLTVRTPGTEAREVVVTRADIQARPAQIEVRLLGPEENIAYLLFPPVPYPNMLDHIFGQIETLSEETTLTGLILDLRVVSQDDSWPLAEMFTVFGSGDLGEIYTRGESTPLEISGRDVFMSQSLPMVILVGPDTRGVLEMFVAALQSSGRATVLGQTTPGAVEGMTPFFLPDGSLLFVPTSSYRTADGREIGLDGVIPDVMITDEWGAITVANDPVRDAALDNILAARVPTS
jgi:carboxyl-terminal processing protease